MFYLYDSLFHYYFHFHYSELYVLIKTVFFICTRYFLAVKGSASVCCLDFV